MIAEPLPLTSPAILLRRERKAQLYERELWKVGRLAQTGDAEALARFLKLLAKYEALEGTET